MEVGSYESDGSRRTCSGMEPSHAVPVPEFMSASIAITQFILSQPREHKLHDPQSGNGRAVDIVLTPEMASVAL